MAWSRLWTAGAEPQDFNELTRVVGSTGAPSTSTTQARTGTYSFRGETTTAAWGRAFSSQSQVRAGVWLWHVSLSNVAEPMLFCWGADTDDCILWNGADDLIKLYVDGSLHADTIVPGAYNFDVLQQWHHAGVVIKPATGSAGWVSLYLNGQLANAWTGLTFAGTTIDRMYVMGRGGLTDNSFNQYYYYDDFYVDGGGGSEPDAAPELHRFGWIIANANGTHSDLTGSDGNSVNNYLQVDDNPADDDTTYNKGGSSGLQDTYNMTTVTTPTDYDISAVIPVPKVKRIGSTEQAKIMLSDGTNDTVGTAQDPLADYDWIQERFTTKPAGGAWSQSDLDGIETGIETAGTF